MPKNRPNVLIVITDQQNFRMMSCAGNPYVSTPAMDSLAVEGVRFDRAYCTSPICVPSRFSIFTGRMPTAIGQRENGARDLPPVPDAIRTNAMGWLLRQAGYETVFAGKQHLPKLDAETIGFDVLTKDERDELSERAAAYLAAEHDKPFCLVSSFINPHDICHMGIREHVVTDFDRAIMRNCQKDIAELDRALQRPEGVDDETFWNELCPPLPGNLEVQQGEPEALAVSVRNRPFRQYIRENWSQETWRLHRWAYRRLTERVDGQIARVLDALRRGPHDRDTLVIFTSDHGDNDASHRLEHKSCSYEEACHVPLIVRPPDGRSGRAEGGLVSNGLDILPTVFDYAGFSPPAELLGRSLRPLIEARPEAGRREHLRLESPIGFGIVTERWKYVLHDYGANREQLYDLRRDPGETRNFAADADCQDALADLRRRFEATFGPEPARRFQHGRTGVPA